MNKKEIFATIVCIVSDVTDISPEEILSSSHREDIVDARHLLVHFLHTYGGLYIAQIAPMTGFSTRHVAFILSSFDTRLRSRRLLRNNYDIIKLKLSHN